MILFLFIIGILCSIIAGVSKAGRDTLAHHFETSIFRNLNPMFWNPVLSGVNKWKNGDKTQGEKFFLSSTLWVALTEAWHIFEMLNVFCLCVGVGLMVFYMGLWGAVISRILYGIAFTIAYHYFELKK
jgi:hypothetical protein